MLIFNNEVTHFTTTYSSPKNPVDYRNLQQVHSQDQVSTQSSHTIMIAEEAPSYPDPVMLLPDHIFNWHLMSVEAVVLHGPRIFVPQPIYEPRSGADKKRYVSTAVLQPPIVFHAENSLEWGVPLRQLLSRNKVQLAEGNDPAFTSCGPSVCIRINWPGYQPLHRRCLTRDYTAERHYITKARLATLVAKCIKRFMDAMSQQPMMLGSDPTWRVGTGPLGINVDDVVLISLHHVSQGSWQPQLRLRRTVGTGILG